MDENGVITRDKARLVEKGYSQAGGIDYKDTYPPIAHLEAIRLLLAIDCGVDFNLYQIGVKYAFLNNYINEEVYVSQPPSFKDYENPNCVFKLKTPHLWSQTSSKSLV